jgi:hypothetical protein
MKKLIVTLAVMSSTLASSGSAVADPGSNVCHRLRYAIASGTRISALPPRLVRDCFGDRGAARPVAPAPAQRVTPRSSS